MQGCFKALKEACLKLKLDPKDFSLSLGKKAVSLDTIARLSGLVNRATLTMVAALTSTAQDGTTAT